MKSKHKFQKKIIMWLYWNWMEFLLFIVTFIMLVCAGIIIPKVINWMNI